MDLCAPGIQYMYGTSSSSSLVSIPNEVRTDLSLSSASDAKKIVDVCMVPREWVKSKFLCQDADVMSLADKCIVIGCFVCGDYDKIIMETEQGHWKWTRVWCWQSALNSRRILMKTENFSVFRLIEIVILWVYYTIPFGFSLFWHFWASMFNFWNYFVWLRITGEGSVPEMRIWSISLIKSDLKWCIHLSRSFFLYFFDNIRVTENGLVSGVYRRYR